jgi:nitroimidazol reductase NimA-like FMN-containing flavoprotein (pyridoxamine 5'-phosphate oxidase superfamily)
MSSAGGPASERTRVKRMPQRAVYDRAAIDAILAEGLICHVGFLAEDQPCVIPTIYAPMGERLLIHGSAASRMLRAARGGIPLCVTITLLDGIVLARSAYHHSMNYRSVMIFGAAAEITARAEKLAAMRALVEHVAAGRWDDVRPPSEAELRATMVLAMPIDEASAKVRTGPPVDDEEDYAMRVWAGVLPLSLDAHAAIADPRMPPDIALPAYARFYRRGLPSVGQ